MPGGVHTTSQSPRAERAPTRARRVGGVGLALPAGVPDFLQVPKRCPLQGSLRIGRVSGERFLDVADYGVRLQRAAGLKLKGRGH